MSLARDWLEGVRLREISPEPARQTATPQRLTLTFDGTAPTTVSLTVEPDALGLQHIGAARPGGDAALDPSS